MSLRTVLTSTVAAVGMLAIGAAIIIVPLAGRIHVVMTDLEEAAQNVRLSQSLSIDLLSYDRANDPAKRDRLAERIDGRLAEIARRSVTAGEARPARQAERDVRSYLGSRAAEPVGPRGETSNRPAQAALDRALGSLEDLSDHYVAEAEAVHRQAMRADRTARIVAFGVALTLLAGCGALLLWLRHRLFQPIFRLDEVVQRLAAGDGSARATEQGVNEIRHIARHFNEMASALDRQRANRIAFLGGVAHDLQNPLSILKVSTAVIAPDRKLPSEAHLRKTIALVGRQVDRLERMASDLLDAGQIEAGLIELHLEEADLSDLAREVYDLFEGESPEHEIAVELPHEALPVRCDPTRIVRVVNNLVSNAIKYSPDGGRVLLRCSRDGDRVQVAVTDQGIGIPESDQRQIFEPFQRLEGPGRKIRGVGLGLFVARRIVEAHGGAIEVESRPGDGSTFRVRLPKSPPIGEARPVTTPS